MSSSRAMTSSGGAISRKADAAYGRFKLVCQGSDADHWKTPAAVTDKPEAVLVDGCEAAEDLVQGALLGRGETKVMKMNSTCTKGDKLCPVADSSGDVRKVPATAGAFWCVGVALEDGADDQEIAVLDCEPVLVGPQHANGQCGLPAFTADPTGVPGQIWYRSDTNCIKAWVNGAAVTIANLLAMLVFVLGMLTVQGADKTPMVQDTAATGKIAAAVLADNVKIPGTLEVTGTTLLTGAVTTTAGFANLGTVTTIDINGGTIDGATIGGSSRGAVSCTNLDANGTVTLPAASVAATSIALPAIRTLSESVTYSGFTDGGSTSGYKDLSTNIPANCIILGWKANVTTGFTNDTSAVIKVGVSGGTGNWSADTAQSCFAVAKVGSQSVAATSFTTAASTPRVTVTSAADFTSVNAGVAVITIYYLQTE